MHACFVSNLYKQKYQFLKGSKMSESNYRIKYRKGDFEIDVQGDKDWVENKFREFVEGTVVVGATGEAAPREVGVLPASSLAEFLRVKGNPSKHTDVAIIFSYWLHKKEKMSSYNVDDIEKCYVETRISKVKNIGDLMNRVQGKAYLMPASAKKDGKKAWVITKTGEEYVKQLK
jgi:hypothetical protein